MSSKHQHSDSPFFDDEFASQTVTRKGKLIPSEAGDLWKRIIELEARVTELEKKMP